MVPLSLPWRARLTGRSALGRALPAVIALVLTTGAALLLAAAAPSASAKPGDYMYVCQFGVDSQSGADDAHLNAPHGVAVDENENVFIADRGNSRILKYQRVSNRKYSLMASWGRAGTGPGEFQGVMGIALDAAGNVYVTENGNSRVQKFSPGANGRTYLWATEWGYPRGVAGSLTEPSGIAVAADGTVWVADKMGNLTHFTAAGEYLDMRDALPWNLGFGSGTPENLACGALGDLWVADAVNNVVVGHHSDNAYHAITSFLAPMGVACASDSSEVFVGTMQGVKVLKASSAANLVYTITDTFGDKYGPGYLGLREWGLAWAPSDPLGDVVFAGSVDRHIVVKFARDWKGPHTIALKKASVMRGNKVKLRFRIEDNIATSSSNVTIVIKKGARIVKKIKLRGYANDRDLTYRYKCTLPEGTYRWCVWAKDGAGNAQSAATAKKLTVK